MGRSTENTDSEGPFGRLAVNKLDKKGRITLPSPFIDAIEQTEPHHLKPALLQLQQNQVVIFLFPRGKIQGSHVTLSQLEPRAVLFDTVTVDQQTRINLNAEIRNLAQLEPDTDIVIESWGDFLVLFTKENENAVAENRKELGDFAETLLNAKRPKKSIGDPIAKQIKAVTFSLNQLAKSLEGSGLEFTFTLSREAKDK